QNVRMRMNGIQFNLNVEARILCFTSGNPIWRIVRVVFKRMSIPVNRDVLSASCSLQIVHAESGEPFDSRPSKQRSVDSIPATMTGAVPGLFLTVPGYYAACMRTYGIEAVQLTFIVLV